MLQYPYSASVAASRTEATFADGEHDPTGSTVHTAGDTLTRVKTAYAVGLSLTSSSPLWKLMRHDCVLSVLIVGRIRAIGVVRIDRIVEVVSNPPNRREGERTGAADRIRRSSLGCAGTVRRAPTEHTMERSSA